MEGGKNENFTPSIDIIRLHVAKNDGNVKLS